MTQNHLSDGAAADDFTEFSESYHARMFPNRKSTFRETDPDFVHSLDNWAFDEVVRSDDTPDALRFKVIIAALPLQRLCSGLSPVRASSCRAHKLSPESVSLSGDSSLVI